MSSSIRPTFAFQTQQRRFIIISPSSTIISARRILEQSKIKRRRVASPTTTTTTTRRMSSTMKLFSAKNNSEKEKENDNVNEIDDNDGNNNNNNNNNHNSVLQEHNNEHNDDDSNNNNIRHYLKKLHSITVCIVPPPSNVEVWTKITKMRKHLKDPGYYRWPPHINLLYPFIQFDYNTTKTKTNNNNSDNNNNTNNKLPLLEDIVTKLESSIQQYYCCDDDNGGGGGPFMISLNQFGIFGGKQRGVLWLDPKPIIQQQQQEDDDNNNGKNVDNDKLQQLHKALETAFPICNDQSKKGGGGSSFTPHMTISHFESKDDAIVGRNILLEEEEEEEFSSTTHTHTNLQFLLDRIYILERKGDDGQFLRCAEIGLSSSSSQANNITTRIYDPPEAFPGMPISEDEWVYEERMKLKQRRRRGGGRGRRRRGRSTSSRSRSNNGQQQRRIPDTPEIIAAKRAERKAKRETN